MKRISKAVLFTTIMVGASLLSTTSASAFEGKVQEGMRGEGREDRFHLMTQEMREEFREEHKAEFENLSEEERIALREEHRAERKANRDANQEEVAEFVGVSTEELREAHDGGTSIGDLLTENGKTEADAEAFLTEKATERVDSIVERHDVSTEQEVTLRSRVSEFVSTILGRWFTAS